MKLWPSTLPQRSVTVRPTMSLPPPAATGTMQRMGLAESALGPRQPGRKHEGGCGLPALRAVAEVLLYLLPLAGGIVLLGLASRNWPLTAP